MNSQFLTATLCSVPRKDTLARPAIKRMYLNTSIASETITTPVSSMSTAFKQGDSAFPRKRYPRTATASEVFIGVVRVMVLTGVEVHPRQSTREVIPRAEQ